MIYFLIPLLTAHVLGDFLLQPNWMSGEAKKRPGILAFHALLHGTLAYLLVQRQTMWPVVLFVGLSHALIDFCKSRCRQSPRAFAIDQFAHGLALTVIAILCAETGYHARIAGMELMIVVTGLVSSVWGAGHFIRTVADRLCEQNPDLREALSHGLENGGAMIGKLERALIFLLVFIGQPGGVGFLIAAKSIIRFEEAKKQPLAEYVLIGTLWSFGLSMAIASASRVLLGKV